MDIYIISNPPVLRYPAAHYFSPTKQVIAVSATTFNGSSETYIESWNYSPSTDISSDPEESFIDFAAPGGPITVLHDSLTSGVDAYSTAWGTSLSAPHVSALCALILSINNTLEPGDIYNILKETADKVDQTHHTYDATTGWNRWLGYGRINAYKALKYTIENYGGTFNQDVILPAGDTWDIQSGVTLKFAANKRLVVNGTLLAYDVTFTGETPATQWEGIKFNGIGSTGSNLDACNITNAYYGIEIYNNTSPMIENCEISDCYAGIYCNQANEPVISNTEITGCSNYGIISVNSDPILNIDDNGIGHNVITQNQAGIASGYGSGVILENGYNSVFNNTGYEVSATNSSFVYAVYTFWNRPNYPYTDDSDFYISSSTVYRNPGLQSNPNSALLKRSFVDNSNEINSESELENSELLAELLKTEKQGNYSQVANQYSELLDQVSTIDTKRYILFRLAKCYKALNRNDFSAFMDSKVRTKTLKDSELYAASLEAEKNFYLSQNNYVKVVEILEKLLKEYSKYESSYKSSLYDLGYVYTFILDDEKAGNKYFNELIKKYPVDLLTNLALLTMGETPDNQNEDLIKQTSESSNLPKDFALLGNYPNPFNPTTEIKFSLPVTSNIKLTIYNMMGQEIKTFESSGISEGTHQFTWNGTNQNNEQVSSGIYIYRLRALGHDGQVFEKSAKMTLLK